MINFASTSSADDPAVMHVLMVLTVFVFAIGLIVGIYLANRPSKQTRKTSAKRKARK